MKQITLNIKDSSKFDVLLNFLKTLDFISIEEDEQQYNSELINLVSEAREDYHTGKTKTVDMENLDHFLGLEND